MTSIRKRGERPGRFSRDRRLGAGYSVAGSLHAIWHRGVLVLCVALSIAGLAATLDALRGVEYTAEALVRVQELGEVEDERASREWLGEVLEAAGPEEVSRSAMDAVGWEGGLEDFNRSLEVDLRDGGELRVGFSSEEPAEAVRGANAYAEAFVGRVEELGDDRLAGGTLGAEAEVAREAASPSLPAWTRPPAVGLAALGPGLLAGCLLALALEGRDRRWRNARDAELTLGAPVLGVIPERGSGVEAGEPETVEDGVVRRP